MNALEVRLHKIVQYAFPVCILRICVMSISHYCIFFGYICCEYHRKFETCNLASYGQENNEIKWVETLKRCSKENSLKWTEAVNVSNEMKEYTSRKKWMEQNQCENEKESLYEINSSTTTNLLDERKRFKRCFDSFPFFYSLAIFFFFGYFIFLFILWIILKHLHRSRQSTMP